MSVHRATEFIFLEINSFWAALVERVRGMTVISDELHWLAVVRFRDKLQMNTYASETQNTTGVEL